jgi:hypothetical protein
MANNRHEWRRPDNNVYLVIGELIPTVYDKADQIRTDPQNYLDGDWN